MVGVTLTDVARRAGVSQPTASRVLNGSARNPRPEVADAVRQAAAELGYVANAQAQALARSSTGLVGVVVHDIADPYFSTIVRGIQQAAGSAGRQVMLAMTDAEPGREHAAVSTFAAHRTDAIILVGSRTTGRAGAVQRRQLQSVLNTYTASGGRVAVIGQPPAGDRADVCVLAPDNRGGARDLASALIGMGHSRFAVLRGPVEVATAADRTQGFTAGLRRAGIAPAAVLAGGFDRDGGYQAATELAESGVLATPTTVFAVNDVMAIGAIAAFRDHRLRVPHDVRVAGFDDIPTLRDHTPGLTTVRLPLEDMGQRIIAVALGDGGAETVRGTVVLRESTRLLG